MSCISVPVSLPSAASMDTLRSRVREPGVVDDERFHKNEQEQSAGVTPLAVALPQRRACRRGRSSFGAPQLSSCAQCPRGRSPPPVATRPAGPCRPGRGRAGRGAGPRADGGDARVERGRGGHRLAQTVCCAELQDGWPGRRLRGNGDPDFRGAERKRTYGAPPEDPRRRRRGAGRSGGDVVEPLPLQHGRSHLQGAERHDARCEHDLLGDDQ